MPRAVDPFLEYYCKLTKSNYLHYGYWNPDEELTLENLHRAQERFADHLISFIPEDVKVVLDVGCGIGGNALRLKCAGFDIEALSPDRFQQQMFIAKDKIPFHLTKFEDFEANRKYDLIMMSESAQYIPIKDGCLKSYELLKDNGFLLVSDFFLKEGVEENNVFAVNIHRKNDYLKGAEKNGFKLIKTEDISLRVIPTLDLAKYKYDDYVKPTLELVDSLLRKRISILYQFLRFTVNPLLKNLTRQLQLIDSQLFLEHREYITYLFQKQ